MKPRPLNLSNKRQSWRNNKPKKNKHHSLISNRLKAKKRFSPKHGSSFIFLHKKTIFLSLLFLSFLVLISVSILIFWLSRGLPSPDQLISREIAQSTQILDSTGEKILYEIHGNKKRTLVDLDNIPKYVQQATIAIEDKNFYEHHGFSLWAIFRTAITNIIKHKKAGASTLTQQFVKNSVLSNEKKYTRKIKEFILAYRLEKQFSKDEILQMYLNEIPYGSTAYGVEAASKRYFGKSVRDINLAEATILAALPQAPSLYSPYGSHKDILFGRQHYILDLMVQQGFITKEEAEKAKNYKLVFKKPEENIKAPHFVMYIKEQLSKKYGEKMIEQGGLKIYTTLDLYKQKIAEEVIQEQTKKNETNYNASNAALVSIDPKNGHILAMVGSRDYFSDKIDGQVNIATSLRQPGSSMKPLVYAALFSKGYTPKTILYDVLTSFSVNNEDPYEPHNYDNKEHGPVNIRKALAGSLNIPAVKAIYLAGINDVLDLAHDVGYTTLNDRDRYGLSLVLGGGEIKLLEHTNAYSVFAREGILNKLTSILKVVDSKGNILEEIKQKETRVMDPKVARMINNVLSDNNARAYAFGVHNWLNLGDRPVAAKTGTTNDYRDAWTIGYTPSIVTGVWVGNNNNTPMKRGAAGGVVAAPIWHDYMKKILGDTPIELFKTPKIPDINKPLLNGEAGSMQTIKIDTASGLLATDLTPDTFIEERTYLQPHSILYYVDKNNPLGDIPKNPENDPQFELWEKGVKDWALKQASTTDTVIKLETPPTEYDNLHIEENLPKLFITYPNNNQNLESPVLIVRVKTSSKRGVNRVEYYLDNSLFSTSYSPPFTLTKRIDFLKNGFHNIKIKSCDDINNCTKKEIEFNLSIKNNNGSILKPSIKINSPQNNSTFTNPDFPLKINLSVKNPHLIAKINLFKIASTSEETLIKTIQPIDTENIEYKWNKVPQNGTYQIKANAITWNEEKISTNNTIITIKK